MTAADPSHARDHDWAASEATGSRILLVGADSAVILRRLAASGRSVVVIPARPEVVARLRTELADDPGDTRSLVTLIEPEAASWGEAWTLEAALGSDRLAEVVPPGGFESVVLLDVVSEGPRGASGIEDAVRLASPGGQLIVTAPFGTQDGGARPLGLRGLRELVRPHASPEQLAVRNGRIRFVGRVGAPAADAWRPYDDAALLGLTEEATFAIQQRLADEASASRREARRLRDSPTYRAGQVLVRAARDPGTAVKLPVTLLRMARGSHAAPTADAEPASGLRSGYPVPAPAPTSEPRVAAIVDPSTAVGLGYDLDLVALSRRDWRADLVRKRPRLLLVEVARDADLGPWMPMAPERDALDPELLEVVAAGRASGIPTAVWATDDPLDLDRHLGLAGAFDLVFTTDAPSVERYRATGHDRVHHLPIAIQPALHNPHRPSGLPDRAVVVAGHGADGVATGLAHALPAIVVDRGDGGRGSVGGSLGEELAVPRSHRLTVGTDPVTASPGRSSRVALESLACGTPVVAVQDGPVAAPLGEVIEVAADADAAAARVQALLADDDGRHRRGHLGYRLVHEQHAWRQRLEGLLSPAGLPVPAEVGTPPVSVIIATSRPENVSHALENYARQAYPDRELFLVLNNNTFDLDAMRRLADGVPNAQVVLIEGRTTLAESMNRVLDRCAGRYVAKMDDDDHYGERYLADLVLAARATRAEIVGKARYFTYLERTDELAQRLLGPEHDDVALVSGATLMIQRDVFRSVRFTAVTRGTDSIFLQDAAAEGCRVYSADRYNFVLVRRSDPRQHTWQIDEAEFRQRCVDIRPGFDRSRVML